MKAKHILILTALLALSGCGYINRMWSYATGYTLVCVKESHVAYVQFPSGAAVLLNASGRPVTCEELK